MTREALLAQLREVGLEAQPTAVSPVGIRLPPVGRVEDVYGYAEGLWQVQDEAAQLVGVYARVPGGGARAGRLRGAGRQGVPPGARRTRWWPRTCTPTSCRRSNPRRSGWASPGGCKRAAHDATVPFPEELGRVPRGAGGRAVLGAGHAAAPPGAALPPQGGGHRPAGRAPAPHPGELPGGGAARRACWCTRCARTEPQEGQDQVEMFLRSHPEWTAEPPVLPAVKLPLDAGVPAHPAGPRGLGWLLRRPPA